MPYNTLEKRRKYQREYYQTTRKERKAVKKEKWVEKLGGKCIRCGYDECIAALQFHHRNPLVKDFAIFDTWRSDDKIEEELKKCDLLCANCHATIHYLGLVV